jgi:hypothetical protein
MTCPAALPECGRTTVHAVDRLTNYGSLSAVPSSHTLPDQTHGAGLQIDGYHPRIGPYLPQPPAGPFWKTLLSHCTPLTVLDSDGPLASIFQ